MLTWKQKSWFNAHFSVASFYIPPCHHGLLSNFIMFNAVLFPCNLSPHWKEAMAVLRKSFEEMKTYYSFLETLSRILFSEVLCIMDKKSACCIVLSESPVIFSLPLFVVDPLQYYYNYSLQNHSQTVLAWNILFMQRTMPSEFS